jgi:hypothetical protein
MKIVEVLYMAYPLLGRSVQKDTFLRTYVSKNKSLAGGGEPMKGTQLDLNSPVPATAGNAGAGKKISPDQRPFLGVQFACCDVYSRIYLNRAKTHYVGNCPHCAKQVRFQVGSGGTDARFFTVH